MGWRQTHPDFDVPDWIDSHPSLRDESKGGEPDVAFRSLPPLPPIDVELEHPHPSLREDPGEGYRFAIWVPFTVDGDADDFSVVSTEDEAVAKRVLAWTIREVRALGNERFAERYWHPGAFDKAGRPKAHSGVTADVPDLSTDLHPHNVRSALKFVNRHRASTGQLHLDPDVASWTDVDILAEADRIGRGHLVANPLKRRLMN